MAAERREITSLQSPPEGWERVLAAHPARRAWVEERKPSDDPRRLHGPRADAEPTAALPTYEAGSYREPTACSHCGGRFLSREEPLGQHQRGTLTCSTCSRQLCWLRARPDTRRFPTSAIVRTRLSAHGELTDRGPGCGRLCTADYGHDPETHERYGWGLAQLEIERQPAGVIRTGPLVVDLDRSMVLVAGQTVQMTALEYRLLAHLAGNLGALCSREDLARAAGWVQHPAGDMFHALRTNLHRLRAKLGPAARLIENQGICRGYALRAEPPEEMP